MSCKRAMISPRGDRVRSTIPICRVSCGSPNGSLIDEAALLASIRDGHLAGAGLESFAVEPPPGDHPFWGEAIAPETIINRAHFSNGAQQFIAPISQSTEPRTSTQT